MVPKGGLEPPPVSPPPTHAQIPLKEISHKCTTQVVYGGANTGLTVVYGTAGTPWAAGWAPLPAAFLD